MSSAFVKPFSGEVTGLGSVTLLGISIGMWADAETAANKARKDRQAEVFTHTLLAAMFIEPKQTQEDIADMAPEVLSALLDFVVDAEGMQEEFDQTATDQSPQERLYQVFLESTREQREKLAREFEQMSRPGTLFGDTVAQAKSAFAGDAISQWNRLIDRDAFGQRRFITDLLNQTSGLNDIFAHLASPADMAHAADMLGDISRQWGDVGQGYSSALARLGDSVGFMTGLRLRALVPPDSSSWLSELVQQADLGQSLAEQWRETLALPAESLDERLSSITLPEPYLSDALLLSGLNSPLIHTPAYQLPPAPPLSVYETETEEEREQRAKEATLERLRSAYDTISRLELALRELVEKELERRYGSTWWKQFVHKTVRDDCEARKQKEETPRGPKLHPIHYSYINHLKDIILRNDTWKVVFGPIFEGEKADVEFYFKKVIKVRNPVAHPRPIEDEDYTFFTASAYWLLARIEAHKQTGESDIP